MDIFKGKLDEMYDSVNTAKLVDMMKNADRLQAEADNLEGQSRNIKQNLSDTFERRLRIASQEEQDKYFEEQMKDLAKQWQILSASMCKVQRSVQAEGFSDGDNLYVNRTYGFKEYKRFSGWNPFAGIRPSQLRKEDELIFVMAENKLEYQRYGRTDYMKFTALYKIPQFDKQKAKELCEMTNDIVRFLLSWQKFYQACDYSMMDDIKALLGYGTYQSNGPDYKTLVMKLPEMIAFKNGIIEKLKAQADSTALVVEKWKEINKNFVVLNELAKIDLNI